MIRRIVLAMVLAGSLFGAAVAGPMADRLVSDLDNLGFDSISVSRTWLGRTRIVADGQDGQREIIFNPVTGEILRDLYTPSQSGPGRAGKLTSGGGGGSGGGHSGNGGSGSSGSGGSGSDDDHSGEDGGGNDGGDDGKSDEGGEDD